MTTYARFTIQPVPARIPITKEMKLPFIWMKEDASRVYLRTMECDVTLCPDEEAGRHTKKITSDEDAWKTTLSRGTGLSIVNT